MKQHDNSEAMSQLPHKLATLIKCLPQAPFRDHLAAECIKQSERIAELEAERDRLRVDAERYQWLRKHSYVEVTCKSSRDPSWTPQQLDTAIDAARTTHKETE